MVCRDRRIDLSLSDGGLADLPVLCGKFESDGVAPKKLLRRIGLSADRLNIEVVETASVGRDPEQVAATRYALQMDDGGNPPATI
jgi:hypothetical protein